MSGDRSQRLLELAQDISDEVAVDWEAESAREPELTATLARLRRVEALATALRRAREAEPEGTPTARPLLFRWGHLEVVEKLGEGSFAEVFRAFDPQLEREVALKLRKLGPSRSEDGGRQFVAEARRLARIRHPNVLSVLGADLHDGRVGLWTELVSGASLDRWLALEGPLDPHEALQIGVQLCRALAAVHGAGLVHGDVKAANVIREQGGRIVLADLGAGVEVEQRSPGEPVFVSPLTAAPELLEGAPPSPAADLYSLGVLLYQLLGGRHPVEAEDLAELRERHARGLQRPLRDLRPDCPPAVLRAVERALEADPGRRYASAGEMERALESALAGQPAPADRAAAASWPRRVALPAAAAVVLVIAAVLLLLPWSRPAEPQPAARPVAPARAVAPRSAPAAAAIAPHGPESRPLEVAATLMRGREGQVEPLAPGASVAPGDHLYLDLEASEPIHLWIVNADREGNAFVLFPLAGVEPGNPLPPGRHRLPGRQAGVPQDWTVTSAGGEETLLLVAAREPLPELESELGRLAAARAGASAGEPVRGVGGLEPARVPAGGNPVDRIAEVVHTLETPQRPLWVRRLELVNPP